MFGTYTQSNVDRFYKQSKIHFVNVCMYVCVFINTKPMFIILQ